MIYLQITLQSQGLLRLGLRHFNISLCFKTSPHLLQMSRENAATLFCCAALKMLFLENQILPDFPSV